MKKNYIIKELAKNYFFNKYGTYVETFKALGILIECKPYQKKKKMYMDVFLKPIAKKKGGYYKSFVVKVLKFTETKGTITHTKIYTDKIFQKFLDRALKQTYRVGCEKSCEENLSNFFLRVAYFWRYKKFPSRYKGHSLYGIYIILVLIIIVLTEIIYLKQKHETAEKLGFYILKI